jgi:exosortase
MMPVVNEAYPPRPIVTGSLFAGKLRDTTWISLFALTLLTLWMYGGTLASLARQWWDDGNYSHGFFVPVVAIYILWRERERWQNIPLRPSNSGLAIMSSAVAMMIVGMLGAEAFTMRSSLIVLIAGMIVFLAGWQLLRNIAFPVAYLFFMIPLPALIYYQLTFPLQLLASKFGAAGLVHLGIPTVREGNLLFLPNCTLEVVDACSGVRSLLSLLAAAVAYSYFTEPVLWKRVALTVSSVPIVIFINGLRLVAAGVLSYLYGPGVDSGIVHLLLGILAFVLALLTLLLVHKVLARITAPARPTGRVA